MNSFSTYTAELDKYAGEILISSLNAFDRSCLKESVFSAKEVERRLRAVIPIQELRDAGSFFTGDELAEEAVGHFGNSITVKSFVIDPACGAGNLLIAVSKKLPVIEFSLRDTLAIWGQSLAGLDLFGEFVETTKLRLILEAVSRGAYPDLVNIGEAKALFPYIQENNAFKHSEVLKRATHIIVNPPFYKMPAGDSCEWADGKVNAAAKFMDLIVNSVLCGSLVSAILPDVLRSGTRYEKWRTLISEKLECSVFPSGRFDRKTDIDVFLLSGTVSNSQEEPDWLGVEDARQSVGDFFDVSIGPVVPYRDKKDGEAVPYIHPKNLGVWDEVMVSDIADTWNYSGTLKKPPFVAIRRTSSPSDTYRAAGTLVKGTQMVAVENHLIVARPKSGRVGDCRTLLEILQSSQANDFLNQRIRCRHLTVSAVREIPWRHT